MEKLETKNNYVFEISVLLLFFIGIFIYFSEYLFKTILIVSIFLIFIILGVYGLANKKNKILSILTLLIGLLPVLAFFGTLLLLAFNWR